MSISKRRKKNILSSVGHCCLHRRASQSHTTRSIQAHVQGCRPVTCMSLECGGGSQREAGDNPNGESLTHDAAPPPQQRRIIAASGAAAADAVSLGIVTAGVDLQHRIPSVQLQAGGARTPPPPLPPSPHRQRVSTGLERFLRSCAASWPPVALRRKRCTPCCKETRGAQREATSKQKQRAKAKNTQRVHPERVASRNIATR